MAAILEKVKGHAKPLSTGSRLESKHLLKENNPESADVDLGRLTGKNIIVGVPGAFTPPCSSQVPGYIQNAEQFAAKGVAGIYIVAVNDQFTVQAWKEKLGGANTPLVHFLADDTGAFTKSIGLDFDASGLLGGHRAKRYVAVVDNGLVNQLFVEDEAPNVTVTKFDNVLQAI